MRCVRCAAVGLFYASALLLHTHKHTNTKRLNVDALEKAQLLNASGWTGWKQAHVVSLCVLYFYFVFAQTRTSHSFRKVVGLSVGWVDDNDNDDNNAMMMTTSD